MSSGASGTGSSSVGTTKWTRSAWGVELTRKAAQREDMRELTASRVDRLASVPVFDAGAIESFVSEIRGAEDFDPHLAAFLASDGALLQVLEEGRAST